MVSERQALSKGIEMPKDWNLEVVENLTLEHKQGYYTKDAYIDKGTYLIRITDLHNPKISFEDMPQVYIDKKTYEQFKVEDNDFLFARSGAIGRYGIYKGEYPEAIFASYLIRFKFNAEKINNRYFGYFYESNLAQRQLGSITQGSSNININANNIKSLVVPLPAISEQQKIISILFSFDEAIEKTEGIIKQTEKVKKGLMQQLLTKGIGHTKFRKTEIGELPIGWKVANLEEVTAFVSRGKSPSYVEVSNLKVINQKCIRWNGIELGHAKFVDEDTRGKWKQELFVSHNDILMNSTGTGTIGRASIIEQQLENTVVDSHVTIIRSNQEVIVPHYLKFYFELDKNQQRLAMQCFTGSTNQVELSRVNLLKFPIVLPTLGEQRQIVNTLTSIEEKIKNETKKMETLQYIKKGLMQSLLTGKIRVKVDEAEVTQV